MKCGNCKGDHGTVDEVRDCFAQTQLGEESEAEFLGLNQPHPPTQPQLEYAHGLLRARVPVGRVAEAEERDGPEAAHEYVSGMDKHDIGNFIAAMKTQPKRPTERRTAEVRVGEGLYRMDGEVYKVQVAVHGSGHLYAKHLCISVSGDPGDPDIEAGWERAYGVLAKLRPEHAMTLEEAKEFGRLYGVCCRCGALLTDETSIAAGIGPICATKFQ